MTPSREFESIPEFLWQPALEASAQTITGMIGAYTLRALAERLFRSNHFVGANDLWYRGIMTGKIQPEDKVSLDGLLSTFTQVFPGNPFQNARRWNSLYQGSTNLSPSTFQALDFVAGSDAALRVKPFNGETLVGLFNQYGYIGEGLVGVVGTQMLRRVCPDFASPGFLGVRARVGGVLRRCPAQHAFVVESIARRLNLAIETTDYHNLYYVDIEWIRPYTGDRNIFTLLGSPWTVTDRSEQQYLLRYAYLSDARERMTAVAEMKNEDSWENAQVFYDELEAPSRELSFSHQFLNKSR